VATNSLARRPWSVTGREAAALTAYALALELAFTERGSALDPDGITVVANHPPDPPR